MEIVVREIGPSSVITLVVEAMAAIRQAASIPIAPARFFLLIRLAVLFLSAVGHAVAERHPSIRLPSTTKGMRLSYLSIGLLLWLLLQPKLVITSRFLEDHLPPPALRYFAWLNRYGKRK